MEKKLLCAVLAVAGVFAFCVQAVDSSGYYIYKPDSDGGTGGWANASRWRDGVAPGVGDKVKINAAVTATVTDSDMETVTNLTQVYVNNSKARMVFNISGDFHMPGNVDGGGTVVKTGTGNLWFDGTALSAYSTGGGIIVSNGTLHLPTYKSTSSREYKFGELNVNAPGILYVVDGSHTVTAGISGDGAISNLNTTGVSENLHQLKIGTSSSSGTYTFSGSLHSVCSITMNGATQRFTRENAPSHTVRLISGVVEATALAGADGDSISAYNEWNMRGESGKTMTIRYVGTGGNFTHKLKFYNDTYNPIIDGGPNGGLNFSGILNAASSNSRMSRLTLTGDHENVCTFSGEFNDTTGLATYVKKTGTGAWRFTGNRKCRGVFAVEKGVLEFASIAEQGTLCSLGYANVLHDNYFGTSDETKAVPYAFLLGDGSTNVVESSATLAYIGTAAASCSTRPIALNGAGRLKNDSGFALNWTGITTKGEAPGVLVLSGDGDVTNIVCDVTNGVGTVAIVKEGTGTWIADWNVNATGGLESRGGVLDIRNDTNYKWFRINFRDNWAATNAAAGISVTEYNSIMLTKLDFWSQDGVRQAVGKVTYNSAVNGRHLLLAPGEACFYEFVSKGYSFGESGTRTIGNLFIDDTSLLNSFLSTNKVNIAFNPIDSNTWHRIVVRLPADAAPIVKYDIAAGNAGSDGWPYMREARSWSLDASVDGVHWDETIHEQDRNGSSKTPTTRGQWYSSKSTTSTGFSIPSNTTSVVKMDSVAYVGASGGGVVRAEATISTSCLKVDAQSAGTIENFAFTENGTLDVANITTIGGLLPGTYVNCTGLENVARWSLKICGKENSKMHIVVEDGKIRIVPVGLIMTIR